jgi:hypothetical protein
MAPFKLPPNRGCAVSAHRVVLLFGTRLAVPYFVLALVRGCWNGVGPVQPAQEIDFGATPGAEGK